LRLALARFLEKCDMERGLAGLAFSPTRTKPPAFSLAAGTEATLPVRDNGIGITAELLPDVFDMFVQGERSADRSQGGLGIGLTLVKRLVQMHPRARRSV
jgi:K+-sensing histidine kinase KdpD